MLERSVRSIVEQTYPNWELILCDDGSTNAALLWMQNLAARDSRIRLLQNDRNLGLARTLNRCLSVANGAYLARQDDDDISKPDRFEKQIAYLESHADVDFVGSNCDLYTPDGGVSGCWNDRNALESRIFCLIRRLYMVRFYFGDGVLKKSAVIR